MVHLTCIKCYAALNTCRIYLLFNNNARQEISNFKKIMPRFNIKGQARVYNMFCSAENVLNVFIISSNIGDEFQKSLG